MRSSTSIPQINADERGLKHRELSETLIRMFSVCSEPGHGFLELVYEPAFAVGLAEEGIFLPLCI